MDSQKRGCFFFFSHVLGRGRGAKLLVEASGFRGSFAGGTCHRLKSEREARMVGKVCSERKDFRSKENILNVFNVILINFMYIYCTILLI